MNKKNICENICPSGQIDIMCELNIDSPVALRILRAIPEKGTYTLSGWIWSEQDASISILIGKNNPSIDVYEGWNRVQLVFDVQKACSIYIYLHDGVYRMYHIQLNAGNTPCNYDTESIVKYIVFGLCNENKEVTVINNSDDDIGFQCIMHFDDEVTNPQIYIVESGECMEIKGSYRKDEIVVIDTRQGRKSVTSIYHGNSTNIINKLDFKSNWLKFRPGSNHVGHSAVSGGDYIHTQLIWSAEYEGV